MVYIKFILVYGVDETYNYAIHGVHQPTNITEGPHILGAFLRISEASVYSRFNWYVPAAVFPAISGKDHERPPSSQHDVPGCTPLVNERGYEQLPFISIYS